MIVLIWCGSGFVNSRAGSGVTVVDQVKTFNLSSHLAEHVSYREWMWADTPQTCYEPLLNHGAPKSEIFNTGPNFILQFQLVTNYYYVLYTMLP